MAYVRTAARAAALRIALGVLGVAAFVLIAMALQTAVVAQPAPPPHPVRVTGTLALAAPEIAGGRVSEITIPDAAVRLERSDGTAVSDTRTLLNGAFELTAPTIGAYRVCWKVGGETGCDKIFRAGPATTTAGVVRFRMEKPMVIGQVLTADGRACWLNDAFFGIDVATQVSIADAGGVAAAAPVRANVQGQYALFGLTPGRYKVTARCEKARMDADVSVGGAARADLVLPNHAPRLTMAANDGVRDVTRVAPGAVVKLIADAKDRDGDPIEYIWRVNGPSGVLAGGPGPTQQWTLPAQEGLQTAYLMARDGAGGYAFRRFDLRAGPDRFSFSGQVLDEATGAPVSNAAVTVGAAHATTGATGWFQVTTGPLPGDRYVLNIRHPNYALASRVYDRSADSATYQLIPAQVTTFPAAGPITIADTRSAGPCGRREGANPTGAGVRRLAQPQVVTDDGDPRPAEQKKAEAARLLAAQRKLQSLPCDARGAEIVIPAGGLVDGLKRPAAGLVRVAVTTLNPARRALPGDDGATTARGEDAGLLSFGAVHVDLRDGAGGRLNLKPGVTAAVSIPVSEANRPQAKPTIPFWSYDEATGRWVEEGSATLQNTAHGWMYVGATKHFSVLNMDYTVTDVAHATCLRVRISPATRVGWTNLILRNYMTYNGTQQQVKEVALDADEYHGIWRIPFGNPIHTSVRLELRGTFGGHESIILDNIIDTDALPHMTGTVLLPPADYQACPDVELTAAPGILPNYGIADAAGRPAFLTGPFGQFNPTNGDAVATAYYGATGAEGQLGPWWSSHGFTPTGDAVDASFTRADYLNFNDLGFGRDMHCTKYGAGLQDLACYVTNYGLPDQTPANADDALNHNVLKRGATVVMTYDHTAGAEKVQFAVYGGGVATSQRINFADLDGFGPKSVPNLCMVCHGGSPSSGGKSQQARFREFDLQSFRYPAGRQWDYSGPNNTSLTNAELTNFARLNQVVQGTTTGQPIGNLIGAWYTGGFAGSPKPVLPAPPTGWSGNPAGYQVVYGKTCRTCHVARDEGLASHPLTFDSATDFTYFGISKSRVCGSGVPKERVMPNSIVTYKNFWADPARVTQFEILAGQAPGTCGT